MASQWANFLLNLGEWRGSFCGFAPDGSIADTTPSILSLEAGDSERLVHFRLRRYGPDGLDGEPIHEMAQDYRNLGKQVVFFANGTFCKGSMQVSPCAEFGGEFGFVDQDRRHRMVQLHGTDGTFSKLVLIREFRNGGAGEEQPPASLDRLSGQWSGEASTINAEWLEPTIEQASFQICRDGEQGFSWLTQIGNQVSERRGVLESTRFGRTFGAQEQCLQLLPDGGFNLRPVRVNHRAAFQMEAGWMPSPGRMQRLIRRYDASGAWVSATQILATCSEG
ncbi:DUF3598 family protein [Synechococcus sp. W4D4]|uniref:DUF3598 family protein n=1 Tax=Synechococcus sp. W4D4 TaxID=3392294 RepID=UPI0039ECD987